MKTIAGIKIRTLRYEFTARIRALSAHLSFAHQVLLHPASLQRLFFLPDLPPRYAAECGDIQTSPVCRRPHPSAPTDPRSRRTFRIVVDHRHPASPSDSSQAIYIDPI